MMPEAFIRSIMRSARASSLVDRLKLALPDEGVATELVLQLFGRLFAPAATEGDWRLERVRLERGGCACWSAMPLRRGPRFLTDSDAPGAEQSALLGSLKAAPRPPFEF